MRVILVLAAVAITAIAAFAAIPPLLDDEPRGRTGEVVATPDRGPFAMAERRPSAAAARERAVAELAERLRVDAAVPRRRGRVTRTGDVALAREMLRATCRGSDRLDECHQAVSSSAIRHVWAALPRDADPAGKAERLLALGAELALTPLQVTNSVRAELDHQLGNAVRSGAIGWDRRDAAITCFDTPGECTLRG